MMTEFRKFVIVGFESLRREVCKCFDQIQELFHV